jgi:hypothetical protein
MAGVREVKTKVGWVNARVHALVMPILRSF